MSEIKGKDKELEVNKELVEQADKVISEFNDEKQRMGSKIKHLMQLINRENVKSEYNNEDDGDVDIEDGLFILESELRNL